MAKEIEYVRRLPDGSSLHFEDQPIRRNEGERYYDDMLHKHADEQPSPLEFLYFGKEQSYPNRDLDRMVDSYILHYVTDGCGVFNGQPIKRGDGFLILPNTPSRMTADAQKPWHFYWIAFRGSDAGRLLKSVGLDASQSLFSFTFFQALEELFDDVIYRDHSDCDANTYMQGVFYMLMAYHKKQAHSVLTAGRVGDRYAKEAAEYMDAHFTEELRISELAAHLHISRKHLAKVFERYMGMTAKEYLLLRRVEAAAELLRSTDMTVPEIAAEVGYNDYTQLSRLFRQKKHCSPLQFRHDRAEKGEKPQKTSIHPPHES